MAEPAEGAPSGGSAEADDAPGGGPLDHEARRRRHLVWLLALGAPLVAEFVSGNLPLTFLWLLVVYAPLYGGAALLVREAGRRSRRPWAVIVVLGLAYGVAEEAFLSGSLFNPDYADLRLLDFGWIPALGMGAWWTVFVVVLHAVWSTCVPIVLVESVAGDLAEAPWLTRRGVAWATIAMLLGAAAVAAVSIAEEGVTPSLPQLAGSAAVVFLLLGLAMWMGHRPLPSGHPSPDDGLPAPRPRDLAIGAGLGATLFVAGAAQAGPVLLTLGGYGVLFAVGAALVVRWSRRPGWGARHRLALATGALVPHVGFALLQAPLVVVPTWVAVAGDVVFTTTVVAFLVLAWRRVAVSVTAR